MESGLIALQLPQIIAQRYNIKKLELHNHLVHDFYFVYFGKISDNCGQFRTI